MDGPPGRHRRPDPAAGGAGDGLRARVLDDRGALAVHDPGGPSVVRGSRRVQVEGRLSARDRRVVLVLWTTASIAWTWLGIRLWAPRVLGDASVYQAGARDWLAGRDLYPPAGTTHVVGGTLAFTYPPFAAVVFGPLARLSPAALRWVVDGAAGGCLCAVMALVAVALARPRPPAGAAALAPAGPTGAPVGIALAALAVAFLSVPVQLTLALGQINTVLAVMVTADVLVTWRWWPRGLLLGVAAAVKLTPLAYLLVLGVARDRRGLASTLAAFVAAGAVGWALMPADSQRYWGSQLFDGQRTGEVWWKGNSCWRAVLARTTLPSSAQTVGWALLSVLTVLAAAVVARSALDRGDRVQALLAGAATQLLDSPVSWLHHWIWLAPGIAWSATELWRRRGLVHAVLLPLVVASTVIGPGALVPGSVRVRAPWTGWDQVLGNQFDLVAVLFLVLSAAAALRADRSALRVLDLRWWGDPIRFSRGAAGRPTRTAAAPPPRPGR